MSVAEGRSEPPPSHVGVRHDLAGIDCEAFAADQARCDACSTTRSNTSRKMSLSRKPAVCGGICRKLMYRERKVFARLGRDHLGNYEDAPLSRHHLRSPSLPNCRLPRAQKERAPEESALEPKKL